MIEVRWHGRGGQGVWTVSNILAMAVSYEGRYVQSFPAFGPERSGAPLVAFTRISDEPIDIHSMVYEPDIVVVLDPTLLGPSIISGLKEDGVIITNYEDDPVKLYDILGIEKNKYKLYVVPATKLALEILKRPITNTAMLGALLKARPLAKIESVFEAIRHRFPGSVGEKNIKLIERAYEETREVS